MAKIKLIFLQLLFGLLPMVLHAESGSDLWFTNSQVAPGNENVCPVSLHMLGEGSSIKLVQEELNTAFEKLFGNQVEQSESLKSGCLVVGIQSQPEVNKLLAATGAHKLKLEGDAYAILSVGENNDIIVITANSQIGLLYGSFHYLRLLRTEVFNPKKLSIVETPSYQYRLLNHWDNLDGTVERGYAGHSIFKWDELPEKVSPRYKQYARANASIGINGTVLNNVNAKPEILSTEYILKTKAIAKELRPYGIKVYLSVNFSSPKELGGLTDSDPLNPEVRQWWKDKAKEIYSIIPDFGGFLVKANSEGLPGPQDYGRTHVDGANMLAEALKPFAGIVMWRAFVYNSNGGDRAKQAYEEFMPFDGEFQDNVIIQVKNGPVDFQPREPISPLFGAMAKTPLMPELQITQEYLGFSDHLCYLGTLFEEFFETDTYRKGMHTTVAQTTDGRVFEQSITGIAGVANIGEDTNWCGHDFAQANWYVFGRMAWNNELSAHAAAKEWLMQSFSHNTEFINHVIQVMVDSREAVVNYMTPIGLHHLMGWGHHYGPEPWCAVPGARADWMPSYYHKADSLGIGFNRSSTGSNAVSQYAQPLAQKYNDVKTCPVELILWFHHLRWDYNLSTGHDVWEELCYRYYGGVESAKDFADQWDKMKGKIDSARFEAIKKKLATQVEEAIWWRDACLLYFQTFSKREIPKQYERPMHKLEELKKMKFNMTHHN